MKVWKLIAALSKIEAGKEIEFSTLLSRNNDFGEGIGTLASYKVEDLIEVGDTVVLFSENVLPERRMTCPRE